MRLELTGEDSRSSGSKRYTNSSGGNSRSQRRKRKRSNNEGIFDTGSSSLFVEDKKTSYVWTAKIERLRSELYRIQRREVAMLATETGAERMKRKINIVVDHDLFEDHDETRTSAASTSNGIEMSRGSFKPCILSYMEQKSSNEDSTEARVTTANDGMNQMDWTEYFLQGQNYKDEYMLTLQNDYKASGVEINTAFEAMKIDNSMKNNNKKDDVGDVEADYDDFNQVQIHGETHNTTKSTMTKEEEAKSTKGRNKSKKEYKSTIEVSLNIIIMVMTILPRIYHNNNTLQANRSIKQLYPGGKENDKIEYIRLIDGLIGKVKRKGGRAITKIEKTIGSAAIIAARTWELDL